MSSDTFLLKNIGRYQIQERIGMGGMARVYKAWDANLDRSVAIKILHEHLADDPTFKERFGREAKFIASFNHPNIVQVFDFNTTTDGGQEVCYMVMPYIAGDTLKDILEDLAGKGERLSHDRIRDIILNVCAALSYAHGRGMVHRDVKPANILFNEHNEAVLTDFGIARLTEGANFTQEGATVGTPTYLSPEQAAGMPVDGRSDLYAVGIMLYEMLAGQPPFTADSNISLILKHMNEAIPPIHEHLKDENPSVEALIYKALAKNPADRYQTAQELAEAVVEALCGELPEMSKPVLSTLKIGDTLPPTNTETVTSPLLTLETEKVSLEPESRNPRNLLIISGTIIGLVIVAFLLLQGTAVGDTPVDSPTPVNSMTGDENLYFVSSFDSDDPHNMGWPVGNSGSVIREISDGYFHFQNALMGSAITTIYDKNVAYSDATIILEAVLDESSPAASGYGIVFRYVDDRNYNVFAVDGMGRFSIWELKDAVWHELRDTDENWTPDEFINPRGTKNSMELIFIGGHLLGWVNDHQVVDVTLDDSATAGNVGIYLATTNSGNADILVDTYQVSSDISSMTG